MVTTRRRLIPHGTSCSFLQAVTQALHSMQRSASQRNFIRAMSRPSRSRRPDLTERDLGFLHPGDGVVAVGRYRVGTFAEHEGVAALRVVRPQVLALEPAPEMERHEGHALAAPLRNQGPPLPLRIVLRTRHPDPPPLADAPPGGVPRVDSA